MAIPWPSHSGKQLGHPTQASLCYISLDPRDRRPEALEQIAAHSEAATQTCKLGTTAWLTTSSPLLDGLATRDPFTVTFSVAVSTCLCGRCQAHLVLKHRLLAFQHQELDAARSITSIQPVNLKFVC